MKEPWQFSLQVYLIEPGNQARTSEKLAKNQMKYSNKSLWTCVSIHRNHITVVKVGKLSETETWPKIKQPERFVFGVNL